MCFASRSARETVLWSKAKVSVDPAIAEANLRMRNAQAAGCSGISVGGYAVALPERGGGVYGIPFMVRCPGRLCAR